GATIATGICWDANHVARPFTPMHNWRLATLFRPVPPWRRPFYTAPTAAVTRPRPRLVTAFGDHHVWTPSSTPSHPSRPAAFHRRPFRRRPFRRRPVDHRPFHHQPLHYQPCGRPVVRR